MLSTIEHGGFSYCGCTYARFRGDEVLDYRIEKRNDDNALNPSCLLLGPCCPNGRKIRYLSIR